jgi:hypothetical protein
MFRKARLKNWHSLNIRKELTELLKLEGPDYSTSAMDVFSEVSDIFGLESGTISFIKEVCELDCLDRISNNCSRIGILFSVVEIVNNAYEGKKTDAFYNTLKASGYFALDYGWSALKIATFAVVILDYTLKRFMKEMIDSHYDEYKSGFYNYFNNDNDVKRDFRYWKAKLNELYAKSNNDNDKFQSLIDEELNSYFSKFWNPEVYIRYLPGFKGDLRPDEKKMLEDSYRKEILNPVFNAVFIGLMENEKRIVDKEIKQETEKLVQNYNSKFKFVVKVNGPSNKINNVPVKIGEWTGLTDAKGYWIFDATFYAYLKNKSPHIAEFTVAPKDVREVKFNVKDKTEITFDMPKPVSIDLSVSLSGDTEGAGFSAMASSLNFDENTIQSETSSPLIEWKWKINDNVINSEEGNIETKSHQISGVLDEAKTYTFTVELINRTEGSSGFNSTIASATKTVTVKKDKTKQKEKEKVIVEKKEEKKEPPKQEKEEIEESNIRYQYICPSCSGYTFREGDVIRVEIHPDYLIGLSSNSFKWQIDDYKLWDCYTCPNTNSLLSTFTGGSSFIFPFKKKGQYRIEVKNLSGTKWDRFVGNLEIE